MTHGSTHQEKKRLRWLSGRASAAPLTPTTWLVSFERRTSSTTRPCRRSEVAGSNRIGCGSSSRSSTGSGPAQPQDSTRSRASRRLKRTCVTRSSVRAYWKVLRRRSALTGGRPSTCSAHPDDMKLHSCATLFAGVSPAGSVFERLLDRYFAGERDDKTLRLVGWKSA